MKKALERKEQREAGNKPDQNLKGPLIPNNGSVV
jgi:hypothetical protein